MKEKMVNAKLYFIENLTFITWLFYVFPYLISKRLPKRISKIYYIDASNGGIFIAKFTLWLIGASLERLKFRLIDIRDEAGNLLRLRITFKDLAEVTEEIKTSDIFQQFLHSEAVRNRAPTFLAKKIAVTSVFDSATLWRALFLIQIAVLKVKNTKNLNLDSNTVLFLNKKVWLKEIRNYAEKYGIHVIPVKSTLMEVKDFIRLSGLKNIIKKIIYHYFLKDKKSDFFFKQLRLPRLAVNYYGNLNLDRPELNSDIFFYQQSQLSGEDILITFSDHRDPIDEQKLAKIKENGMAAVALSFKARKTSFVPLFYHLPKWKKIDFGKVATFNLGNLPEYKWFKHQIKDYYGQYEYWTSFFKKYNIKIYVTWYKYDSSHCVIADALESLGGVTAIYQRAFEELTTAETTIASDIVFAFSKIGAEKERQSNSIISYYVVTGYLGDYRFPLLKKQAQDARDRLKHHGARYILAFFDENSNDDSRWHTGHEFMRENYIFLLEKVLSESWLGLVLKPKVPSTLRKRLGSVAELLSRAEATGRCFVFEGGLRHGSYPPAIAALISDIAIHGHLCGATAGMESALTGTPTLLMDREGWPVSKLYRLGKGRVVFNDWQQLWEACKEHWSLPSGLEGFGEWSIILDELDPFRDGKAAERIGTYLKWLLDGFKAGLSRDVVMADAAECYCKIWGKDKITEVK